MGVSHTACLGQDKSFLPFAFIFVIVHTEMSFSMTNSRLVQTEASVASSHGGASRCLPVDALLCC